MQILGKDASLAAHGEHSENRVENVVYIDHWGNFAWVSIWDQRGGVNSFGVGQIGQATKTATIGSKTVFRLSHWCGSGRDGNANLMLK